MKMDPKRKRGLRQLRRLVQRMKRAKRVRRIIKDRPTTLKELRALAGSQRQSGHFRARSSLAMDLISARSVRIALQPYHHA